MPYNIEKEAERWATAVGKTRFTAILQCIFLQNAAGSIGKA